MGRLFLRIFLWFWLGIVLVGAAVALTSMWAASQGLDATWRGRLGSTVRLSVHTLAESLRREGPGGLPAAAGRLEDEEKIRVWVITPDGADLAHPGETPPGTVTRMAREILGRRRGRTPHFLPWEGRLLVAHRLRGENGRPLVVVLALPQRPPFTHLVQVPTLAVRFLLVFGIATLLCWALARYFTRPVRMLREATARLAAGELDVRVGGTVGRRGDEIGDLARDFDRMADRLEEMVTSRERLLRDVSHELRSPLARLAVALELARDAKPGETEPLDRIELEAGRLNELIGELLALTRLDEAGGDRRRERIAVGDLAGDVAEDAGYEARGRDVEVRVTVDGSPRVTGSVPVLRSALENVVRNAIRFAPAGTTVDVEVGSSGGECFVTVRDRGPGVAEELFPKLFEPFATGEPARGHGGGSGLGLAITRRAVELHGGSVSARNREGGGLEVTIRLPLAGEEIPAGQ